MRLPARLLVVAGALAAGLSFLGCTSTSTSVAAPTAEKCQVTATNQPSLFPHNGGAGTITIATARDCTWALQADAPWISIAGDRTGQGEAVLRYTVSENPVPSSRTASISVESTRLQLSQAGAPCTYSLNPSSGSIAAAAGSLSFAVTTLTGCSWSATSNAAWLQVTAGHSGNASATVSVGVTANTGAQRVGNVSVAGQNYTVTQAAAASGGGTPPPPPPPPPPPQVVEFDGKISSISGSCPNRTFVAAGRTVVTDAGTEYKDGGCKDLSRDDKVKVRGTVQANGSVRATRIDIKEDEDDD